ncbi:MAG: cobyric acid synthase [Bacteroidaceae bacterium]|nr:cobyric acid synthase [Bacteroidaceae bacterium]
MKRLHPIMLAGTGSDVGKSILATALCRIFLQDGYHPAPFKAQNMALNSFATPEGLEIGRAQAVQAEAAGIPCHTDMNPLLLKPQSDHTSQVVLHGIPIGNRDAYDFWHKDPFKSTIHPVTPAPPPIDFPQEVHSAFDRLTQRYNPIVMEGAGSIAEINLRDHDLVNMPMAQHAHADVILVGDIDRGGVFASVYGSIALQTPEDKKLIKGIIINKFRGDLRLFEDGRKMLEELCGVPVLGVVPYYKDIHIDEEDSVALERKAGGQLSTVNSQLSTVSVAVVLLRHLSNFTDFNVLECDPRVHLFYTNNTEDLLKSDIIIIPGSKSTLSDLYELRRNGVAQAIIRAHRQGATVMGICGGYQMMGVEVCDPHHVEGEIDRLPGLGLLPTITTMSGEKVTRQVTCEYGCGYEIHMGETRPLHAAPSPLLHLNDGTEDGYFVDDHCMGTYVHGILDNPSFIEKLLAPFKDKMAQTAQTFDYTAFKEEQYDKLAAHVRQHLNMDLLYQILSDND